jgi:hypothetical protein
VFPFEEGDDEDPSMILNIIPELAIPFNTKKRAPFKIVVETVKPTEITQVERAKELLQGE